MRRRKAATQRRTRKRGAANEISVNRRNGTPRQKKETISLNRCDVYRVGRAKEERGTCSDAAVWVRTLERGMFELGPACSKPPRLSPRWRGAAGRGVAGRRRRVNDFNLWCKSQCRVRYGAESRVRPGYAAGRGRRT